MSTSNFKIRKLGEIITLHRGYDLPSSKRLTGDVPIISSGGLTGWHNEARVAPPGVITGRYGSIGEVYYISEPFWPLNTTLFVSNFFGNDPLFIFYLLKSLDFSSFSDKTGVPGVNRNDLHLIRVMHPPLPEQKKSPKSFPPGTLPSSRPASSSKPKKCCKKALMQQLLTGRTKPKGFEKDSWNIVPLGKLVSPVSRPVAKPEKTYLSIGLRSHCKGTFHKYIDDLEKIKMDTLYRVNPDDLIVNITFAWEGAIAFAKEENLSGLVSHRFPTFRIIDDKADIKFVRNLILTKRFIWDLGLISPGGAGRNRVMNKKDFLKIKVCVPLIKTQKKIGQILSTTTNEIN